MNREVRERLILPFIIPIGALAFIAALVFLLSRVLLAAPREVAVAVALMLAINILVVCALLAIPPRGLRVNPLLVVAVALAPLAFGVVSTGVVEEGIAEEGHRAAPAQTIEIAAVNTAFDKSQLTLQAGRKAVVKFNNRDAGVPHNVGIFAGKDASGEKVFTGELFPGPRSVEYRVPPLAAGSYFFRCDVHPTVMIGTIAVGS